MYLEDIYDEELGAVPKAKKKKKSFGSKLKRGLKAVASGGMSEAARAAKKTKLGRKIMKGAGAVMTGGVSLAIGAAKKKLAKTKAGKLAGSLLAKKLPSKVKPKMTPIKAKKVIAAVKAKPAGSCSCKDDMAKLVAAKLIAELGPPLNEANRALAKLELQRKATYEHKKLMTDSEFRRKVLSFIARSANNGNRSAKRTINCLRG